MRFPLFMLLTLATASAGCADKSPPTFAGDAAITVEESSPRALHISWPEAQDDEAVRFYRVFRDDEQVAELPASVHAYILEELEASTDYLVAVVAVDEARNVGERLSLVAATADGVPPSFGSGARLRIRDVSADDAGEERGVSLELSWPAATDATGIAHYNITHEGQPVAEVPAGELSYRLEGDPGQNLDGAYGVIAEDEAGNRSAALAARFPTLELEGPSGTALSGLAPAAPAPSLAAQPQLRLNPGLSRALRPANLRRIRLLGSPALNPSVLGRQAVTPQPAPEPQPH